MCHDVPGCLVRRARRLCDGIAHSQKPVSQEWPINIRHQAKIAFNLSPKKQMPHRPSPWNEGIKRTPKTITPENTDRFFSQAISRLPILCAPSLSHPARACVVRGARRPSPVAIIELSSTLVGGTRQHAGRHLPPESHHRRRHDRRVVADDAAASVELGHPRRLCHHVGGGGCMRTGGRLTYRWTQHAVRVR